MLNEAPQNIIAEHLRLFQYRLVLDTNQNLSLLSARVFLYFNIMSNGSTPQQQLAVSPRGESKALKVKALWDILFSSADL